MTCDKCGKEVDEKPGDHIELTAINTPIEYYDSRLGKYIFCPKCKHELRG